MADDVIDLHAFFAPTPHADVPDWMNDYFRQIASDILDGRDTTIEPIHVEPYRKFDGQLIFADGTDFNPGNGRGLYYWDSHLNDDAGGWVPTSSRGGFGGVAFSGILGLPDINATPQVIPASSGIVTFPIDVTQDADNDGIRYEKPGIWQIDILINLLFVGENFARNLVVELYDATADVVTFETTVPVGRNQEGVNITVGFLVNIIDSVGNLFQVRLVSTTDTFSTVILITYSFATTLVAAA